MFQPGDLVEMALVASRRLSIAFEASRKLAQPAASM
jgi:hypothetical protein